MTNFQKHLHNKYGFTIVDNKIFIEKKLDLRAIGLLIQLLSLPEDWNYSIKGLARICKDGESSIAAGLDQLKKHGYLTVERERKDNGKLGGAIYHIYEDPEDNIEYQKNLANAENAENEEQENIFSQAEIAKSQNIEPQPENQADLTLTQNKQNEYTKDNINGHDLKSLDIIEISPELENPVQVNLSEKQNSQPKREKPKQENPDLEKPEQENPDLEKPEQEKPNLENRGQYSKYKYNINNKILNNKKLNNKNNNINNTNNIYKDSNHVVENLIRMGLLRPEAEHYVAEYGVQRAAEILSATAQSPKIQNKAGWIISAFEHKYILQALPVESEKENLTQQDYTASYAEAREYAAQMVKKTRDVNWFCPHDYPIHGLISTPHGMTTLERAKQLVLLQDTQNGSKRKEAAYSL